MICYHGTSEASARVILVDGIDVDAARRADAGDFGRGFYLTDHVARARCYGSALLAVDVDVSKLARVPNPYFLAGLEPVEPTTPVERLFVSLAFDDAGRMLTVEGDDEARALAARRVRDGMLAAGFAGIIAGPFDRPGSDREIVLFDPRAAVSVERCREEPRRAP